MRSMNEDVIKEEMMDWYCVLVHLIINQLDRKIILLTDLDRRASTSSATVPTAGLLHETARI